MSSASGPVDAAGLPTWEGPPLGVHTQDKEGRVSVVRDAVRGQFGNPRGVFGQIAGWIMAWENRERNAWAVDVLNAQPGDDVLEIGFGPGLAVERLVEAVGSGTVAGVDRSAIMVAAARSRVAEAVAAGRVDLRRADVEALPFDAATFDRALAINTVHHWADPIAGLREVRRVLRPGGVLAVVEQPHGALPAALSDARTRAIADEMRAAGFNPWMTRGTSIRGDSVVCVLAVR
jgi:ubiquinone/menaquinone biosynthesis C-methylase UbiE